jgi:hypothetical protein
MNHGELKRTNAKCPTSSKLTLDPEFRNTDPRDVKTEKLLELS